MKQLTQSLKDGTMSITEVPAPACKPGYVLVRTLYSAVSAGTEGKTVSDARKGLIAKARSRKKEVRMVLDLARTAGIRDTYRIVRNKLDAYSPLGYACMGEVIEVAADVTEFRVGDLVACGGADAAHAEIVCVGRNLCALLPDGVDARHAAITTIAAIALQGVRQAELHLGETAVVIGLGLIGQLTMQYLRAQGCTAIGVDIDERQLRLARSLGFPYSYHSDQAGLEATIADLTHGIGADAVIITAGSASLWPVNFAGAVSRKKGKVVIVGAVPTGFDRKDYYRKELDLRMSSSYGPGRYDSRYEEQGVDYPVGYVRWTEQRNMQAYLDLLASGYLDIEALISHEFPLEQAKSAYDTILARQEHVVGVLLSYEAATTVKHRGRGEHRGHGGRIIEEGSGETAGIEGRIMKTQSTTIPTKTAAPRGAVRVSFIGAGSFAQNMILPNLKGLVEFRGVATGHGNTAQFVMDKYGFAFAAGDADMVLRDEESDAVFIMTRHDSHARYVVDALRADKDVFVEKPLALYPHEIEEIEQAYAASKGRLMLGFNRRFAPQIQQLKALYRDEQVKSISYRINAGNVPPEHWVHNPAVGGGRIIGEACHFIDLCMYLAGAPISSVQAVDSRSGAGLRDTVAISLGFANGSIANISYFSNGSKQLPKERIEVFCGGSTAVLDDFRELHIYGDSVKSSKLKKQDKGHAAGVRAFVEALRNGTPSPIPFDEIVGSTWATFGVMDKLRVKI